jgi:hypothetical protein
VTDEFPEPNFPAGPSLEPPAEPRLRRSRTDRVFAGVCGGMGHYFRIDPIILRIVMVALIFAGSADRLPDRVDRHSEGRRRRAQGRPDDHEGPFGESN